MKKFSIAFVIPGDTHILRHRIVEAEEREQALQTFFNQEATEYYTNDEKGFHYFKEDFFDESNPGGSIIETE